MCHTEINVPIVAPLWAACGKRQATPIYPHTHTHTTTNTHRLPKQRMKQWKTEKTQTPTVHLYCLLTLRANIWETIDAFSACAKKRVAAAGRARVRASHGCGAKTSEDSVLDVAGIWHDRRSGSGWESKSMLIIL